MEQRTRIFELAQEGLKEIQIESQLKIEFGQHAYNSKTIYKWMARQRLGYQCNEKDDVPGKRVDDQLLKRITEILNAELFSSSRTIAQRLKEDNSTIWRYLTKYLGYVYSIQNGYPIN